MLEPVRELEPDPGFLQGLAAITRKHGTLVIFDKMVTGLRLAPGGTQEYYGVIPDLACFGKSIANGLPLSITVGPKDLMRVSTDVFTQMTFQYKQLSLAAARVVADEIVEQNVPAKLWEIGKGLKRALEQTAHDRGIRISVSGPAPRQTISFPNHKGFESKKILNYFLEVLLESGVICNGNLLPCAALTEADVQKTHEAFSRAMTRLAEALEAGDLIERTRFPFSMA